MEFAKLPATSNLEDSGGHTTRIPNRQLLPIWRTSGGRSRYMEFAKYDVTSDLESEWRRISGHDAPEEVEWEPATPVAPSTRPNMLPLAVQVYRGIHLNYFVNSLLWQYFPGRGPRVYRSYALPYFLLWKRFQKIHSFHM